MAAQHGALVGLEPSRTFFQERRKSGVIMLQSLFGKKDRMRRAGAIILSEHSSKGLQGSYLDMHFVGWSGQTTYSPAHSCCDDCCAEQLMVMVNGLFFAVPNMDIIQECVIGQSLAFLYTPVSFSPYVKTLTI